MSVVLIFSSVENEPRYWLKVAFLIKTCAKEIP